MFDLCIYNPLVILIFILHLQIHVEIHIHFIYRSKTKKLTYNDKFLSFTLIDY